MQMYVYLYTEEMCQFPYSVYSPYSVLVRICYKREVYVCKYVYNDRGK